MRNLITISNFHSNFWFRPRILSYSRFSNFSWADSLFCHLYNLIQVRDTTWNILLNQTHLMTHLRPHTVSSRYAERRKSAKNPFLTSKNEVFRWFDHQALGVPDGNMTQIIRSNNAHLLMRFLGASRRVPAPGLSENHPKNGFFAFFPTLGKFFTDLNLLKTLKNLFSFR